MAKDLESQVETIKAELGSKVGWAVFAWIVGVSTTIIMGTAAVGMAARDKAETAGERVSDVEGDIKVIKSDLTWIRQSLEKQNGK